MKHLLKFYRYMFEWENYLLLIRTVQAARLVKRVLPEHALSPHFASAVAAVDGMYLPQQPGWSISDDQKISRFAAFVTNIPTEWGKCVQQSLILYRLLNAYGIPAQICFGVSRIPDSTEGHAWVVKLSEPEQAVGETANPRERFTLVYVSPVPNGQPVASSVESAVVEFAHVNETAQEYPTLINDKL